MAELPKNIRKVGGEMVAARSPFARRVLLPTEADLCNALGITEEEYFQFLEGVAAKVKERPAAYDLIPDIRCDPVSLGLATQVAGGGLSLTFLGQVAVGVALTAASALLTPKPPSMKQGSQQRTADIGGTKKFAPQFSFNSVQDLANLGDLVPLIFTNRQLVTVNNIAHTYGGVRVNSQLIWSQMVSLGRYQQLKVLALFSLGDIEKIPDFRGYAIGDLLIENYHSEKILKATYGINNFSGEQPPHDGGLAYYTNSIPFQRNGGHFPDSKNVFLIDDKRHFSGTRNPTTQATFGLSNPMPNATPYKLPYELVRTASDISSDDARPAGRIALKKRRKLLGAWPMGAGFMNITGGKHDVEVQKGTEIYYQITGSTDSQGTPYSGQAYQQSSSDPNLTMDPHGVEDVNAATKTVREATDSYLAIGEQYMAGTALVSCVDVEEGGKTITGAPWDGTEVRTFSFKVVEPGRINTVLYGDLATHLTNPRWKTPEKGFPNAAFFTVRAGDQNKFYYEQDYQDIYDAFQQLTLQKVNLGTISNNRKCHITEIGIKSKVFKQIQFANVNSKPSEDELYKIYDNRSSLQLGNINKYITRYSFFKLQVRKSGETNWTTLTPNQNTKAHTGLFCVRGNTPEFQYNYIRIEQPDYDQYEYRFLPHPGAAVVKDVKALADSERTELVYVMVLNANAVREETVLEQFNCSVNGKDYSVKFAGDKYYSLTEKVLSNREWNLGEPSSITTQAASIRVTGFSKNSFGNYPGASISNLPIARQSQRIFTDYILTPHYGSNYVSGHGTVIVAYRNRPNPGQTIWWLYINGKDIAQMINQEQFHDGAGTWLKPATDRQSDVAVYYGNDHSRVEFHYTTTSNAGGKFTPNSFKALHPGGTADRPIELWSVNRDEQKDITVPPTFQGVVMLDGGEGSAMEVDLTVYKSGANFYAQWELHDVGNNAYENNDVVYIDAGNDTIDHLGLDTDIEFQVKVDETGAQSSGTILDKLNPYDAAADMWQYEGDKGSHLDGPEHQITYCNEIVKTGDSYASAPASYEDLAYAGLRINSSKEWTNFSQFSAYFKKGIKVKSLIDGTQKATSLFPEIAYALLTDKRLGAGKVISESSVDEGNMEIAARFCQANGFFWDGVISSKVNLREFIYQQALYCLLDFTIIGGKFSLFPAVPFNYDPVTGAGDFTINLQGKPKIKAMFTDGNISDLSVSFLSPEDRQAFKANVLYREEKENGFPETKSAVIRLAGSEHIDDPLETFDLSGFCTNRISALWFARYTLALRKHLDHTVSFKTAPHYINGVRPGDYIRVFSTTQHVQRFNNGAILEDGTVVSKDSISGSKTFYYWNPSTIVAGEIMPVTEATVDFSNTNAVKAFAGSLFTIKEEEASDQCYKVESITFGDDGLVELTGSYAELTDDGKLAMLQNWSGDSSIANRVFQPED